MGEGSGEFAAKEKTRFYRMARRSATECSAVIDVLLMLGAVASPEAGVATGLLGRIVAMLIGLTRR